MEKNMAPPYLQSDNILMNFSIMPHVLSGHACAKMLGWLLQNHKNGIGWKGQFNAQFFEDINKKLSKIMTITVTI